MRTVIAFLVAPSIGMVPAAIWPEDWGSFAFLTLGYAYPLALFVGVPGYLYFRRIGWLSFWRVVGAGAVIGSLMPTIFALWLGLPALVSSDSSTTGSPNPILGMLALLLFGALFGAAIAIAFWFIAFGLSSRASRADQAPGIAAAGK